jgi:hypothetical protein
MSNYIGKIADSDWFSENLVLANRVTGACRSRKGEVLPVFFLDCLTFEEWALHVVPKPW